MVKRSIIAMFTFMLFAMGVDMMAGCKNGSCAIRRPAARTVRNGVRRANSGTHVRRGVTTVKPAAVKAQEVPTQTVEVKQVPARQEPVDGAEELVAKKAPQTITTRIAALWRRVKQLWS